MPAKYSISLKNVTLRKLNGLRKPFHVVFKSHPVRRWAQPQVTWCNGQFFSEISGEGRITLVIVSKSSVKMRSSGTRVRTSVRSCVSLLLAPLGKWEEDRPCLHDINLQLLLAISQLLPLKQVSSFSSSLSLSCRALSISCSLFRSLVCCLRLLHHAVHWNIAFNKAYGW